MVEPPFLARAPILNLDCGLANRMASVRGPLLMLTWRSMKYRIAFLSNLVALAVGFMSGLLWIPKLVSTFGLAGKFLVVTAVILLLLWMVRFFEVRTIKD